MPALQGTENREWTASKKDFRNLRRLRKKSCENEWRIDLWEWLTQEKRKNGRKLGIRNEYRWKIKLMENFVLLNFDPWVKNYGSWVPK